MGKIRAGIIYANPRLEIIGIVDLNLKSAQELADTYSVSRLFKQITFYKHVSTDAFYIRHTPMDVLKKQSSITNAKGDRILLMAL